MVWKIVVARKRMRLSDIMQSKILACTSSEGASSKFNWHDNNNLIDVVHISEIEVGQCGTVAYRVCCPVHYVIMTAIIIIASERVTRRCDSIRQTARACKRGRERDKNVVLLDSITV